MTEEVLKEKDVFSGRDKSAQLLFLPSENGSTVKGRNCSLGDNFIPFSGRILIAGRQN